MIKFSDLLDTRKCYEMIKLHRWPEGVICPHCDSSAISLRSETTVMQVKIVISAKIAIVGLMIFLCLYFPGIINR